MSATAENQRLTVADIARMHGDGTPIPMLTAYDFPTARLLDEAGIPLILVGDSVGEVMLGYESTVRVSMEDMLHHTRAVVRGAGRSLVIGDMPFMSYATVDEALDSAGRFLREAGAQAVKVEGGVRTARVIEALVNDAGATAPPESRMSRPPASIVCGAPKPLRRPSLSWSNLPWLIELIANMTMNSTISSVIMSA